MKKAWLAVCMAVWLGPAWTEPGAIPFDEKGVAAARASINAEREAQNALFAAEGDACLTRFAVTDCQNDVTKRQRADAAEFKRREAAINDAVRKQRVLEQAQRTQEKITGRIAGDGPVGAGAQQDRERAVREKIRNHPKPVGSNERRAKDTPVVAAKVLEDRRKAYADRQLQLLKKRQERDKRLQDKGPARPGLPTPP